MGKEPIQLAWTQGPHGDYAPDGNPFSTVFTIPGSARVVQWSRYHGMHYRWLEFDQINNDLPQNLIAPQMRRSA